MNRLLGAWRALEPEQRLAGVAALALLVSMFFPWYGLQSLNRRTGADLLARDQRVRRRLLRRGSHLPRRCGRDGESVRPRRGPRVPPPGRRRHDRDARRLLGGLLIFYRVFSRPAGDGYPVGIEWGFFLAFVAAGGLAYAGWRMRASERPEAPLEAQRQAGGARPAVPSRPARRRRRNRSWPRAASRQRTAPVPARGRGSYPPAPPEQLSFEDPPPARSEPDAARPAARPIIW